MEKRSKSPRTNFAKIIRRLMAEQGVKSYKELTDKINEVAGEKYISPNSVGKWFRPREQGGSEPKGRSLILLAKALKADLFVFQEGQNGKDRQGLKEIVAELVKSEMKNSPKELTSEVESELLSLLRSEKIPQEDKDGILRQIRNLFKLYGVKEV